MTDPELLIMEIEKRPVVWNIYDEEYKDKNKKNTAWVEIASSLFDTFNTKTEAEQKIIVQDIMSKWRTIRDNYVRNRKRLIESTRSGASATKIKRYIYEEQLKFLKKNMEMRPTTSSIDNNQSNNENDNYSIDNSDIVVDENVDLTNIQTPTISKKLQSKKGKKNNIEDKLLNFMDAHQPKTDISPSDEDYAFFISLLPTVRKLNVDQKYTFRIQTMQLLHNLSKSYINTSIESSSSELPSRPSSTASYFSSFSPPSEFHDSQYL